MEEIDENIKRNRNGLKRLKADKKTIHESKDKSKVRSVRKKCCKNWKKCETRMLPITCALQYIYQKMMEKFLERIGNLKIGG